MRGPPAVYCHPNLQREILEVSLNLLIDTFLLNISKFCLNTYYVYHSGQILLKVTICVISIFIKLYPLIATTLVFMHQGGTRCFCVCSAYLSKGCLKKMSRSVFFNFSGLEKAAVLNDTFLQCILKELSKTVFKSFLRQFLREIR